MNYFESEKNTFFHGRLVWGVSAVGKENIQNMWSISDLDQVYIKPRVNQRLLSYETPFVDALLASTFPTQNDTGVLYVDNQKVLKEALIEISKRTIQIAR